MRGQRSERTWFCGALLSVIPMLGSHGIVSPPDEAYPYVLQIPGGEGGRIGIYPPNRGLVRTDIAKAKSPCAKPTITSATTLLLNPSYHWNPDKRQKPSIRTIRCKAKPQTSELRPLEDWLREQLACNPHSGFRVGRGCKSVFAMFILILALNQVDAREQW